MFLDQSRIEAENALKEVREHCQFPKVALSKVASELEAPGNFESLMKVSSIGEALEESINEE